MILLKKIILIFIQIIKIFKKLDKKFIYGDINSKNFIIGLKNKVHLIDFESVSGYSIKSKKHPIGTKGFFSKK